MIFAELCDMGARLARSDTLGRQNLSRGCDGSVPDISLDCAPFLRQQSHTAVKRQFVRASSRFCNVTHGRICLVRALVGSVTQIHPNMCLSDANRFHTFLSCGLSGQVLRLTVRRGSGLTKLKHTFGRVIQQPALTCLAVSANGRFRSATQQVHQSRFTQYMQQASETLLSRRRSSTAEGKKVTWGHPARRVTDCLLLVNAVMFATQLLSKGRITAWGMKAQLCSIPASEREEARQEA